MVVAVTAALAARLTMVVIPPSMAVASSSGPRLPMANLGSITIAGVNYDLAKGSLFLVSAREELPKVAQINFDLSGFPEGDALKAFAKSNPQIREFFEKHKKEDAKSR
ncbi:MAG TPA: hypothetical protein VGY66_31335 [Gemmataceae bacterium]|jgi:hypothetical protein|nr:hypothetical protein [Gemmataceae bacterium]